MRYVRLNTETGKNELPQKIIDKIAQISRKTCGRVSSICSDLKINRTTFSDWRRIFPEVEKAYSDGIEDSVDGVEGQLLVNCHKGNQRAIEYFLNNRRPAKWKSKAIMEMEGTLSFDTDKILKEMEEYVGRQAEGKGEN